MGSRVMFHTMNTKPGHSGAPIFQDGRVVAIHLGALPEKERNYCVSMRGMDGFLKQQPISIQESDAPERAIDRRVAEEEFELASRLVRAEMFSNPSSRSFYDDIDDALNRSAYGDGAFDDLLDREEELNQRAEKGDEAAIASIRVIARVRGTHRPNEFSFGKRKLEISDDLKERVLRLSTGRNTTPLSNPPISKQKTPEASVSSSVEPLKASGPNQNHDFDLLSKRLDSLSKMMESILLREGSARASDNSTTPPVVEGPSSKASATKRGVSPPKAKETSRASQKQSKV